MRCSGCTPKGQIMLTSWNQALLKSRSLSHHQKVTLEQHENMSKEECNLLNVKREGLAQANDNTSFSNTLLKKDHFVNITEIGFVLILACNPITVLTEMLGRKLIN